MSTFYRILDQNIIGHRDGMFECFIYDRTKGWIPDLDNILMDRIMRYDDSEELGSPYRMGDSDMMSRIEEITEDEANILIDNMQ